MSEITKMPPREVIRKYDFENYILLDKVVTTEDLNAFTKDGEAILALLEKGRAIPAKLLLSYFTHFKDYNKVQRALSRKKLDSLKVNQREEIEYFISSTFSYFTATPRLKKNYDFKFNISEKSYPFPTGVEASQSKQEKIATNTFSFRDLIKESIEQYYLTGTNNTTKDDLIRFFYQTSCNYLNALSKQDRKLITVYMQYALTAYLALLVGKMQKNFFKPSEKISIKRLFDIANSTLKKI